MEMVPVTVPTARAIYPVVLCGGMGSRLWPLSRVDQPKQFQPTAGPGSSSYFQATMLRHRGPGYHAPVVVTNARHGAIINRQMRELQLSGTVIAEPVGRNTGPAVLAAALTLLRDDPDAQILVLPSDHVIKGDLNAIILAMTDAADDGRIITFGVEPRYPETGYGYITDGGALAGHDGLHAVERFVEKPGIEVARALLEDGQSYWASGISLFRADHLVQEYRRFDPVTATCVEMAVAQASRRDLPSGLRGHMLLEETSFAGAHSQPTERVVFERSQSIALAPLHRIEWDDVGAWNAVHQISERTEDENVLSGDVVAIDTRNSLVQADGRLVAVIGMDNVVVVDTPDALLVTNRDRAQDVKGLVERLLREGRHEVRSHVSRDTSWGQVEVLGRAPGYDMRLITVNPGSALSVNGTGVGPSMVMVVSGEVECDHATGPVRLRCGQSVEIAADVALPLYNPMAEDLRLIQIIFTARRDGEVRGKALGKRTPAERLPQLSDLGLAETAARPVLRGI